jgi:hypothetical protein
MDELWREFDRVKTNPAQLDKFHGKIASLKFLDIITPSLIQFNARLFAPFKGCANPKRGVQVRMLIKTAHNDIRMAA